MLTGRGHGSSGRAVGDSKIRKANPVMNRFGMAAAALLAVATFVLSGCSSVVNEGGNTTCKEFKGQDEAKQNSEIVKMLKDRNGKEPNNLEITATRVSAKAFCETLGKDSSKISDINHG